MDTDSDNDGISDIDEILTGTDPYNSDSDGDGISDSKDTMPLDRDNDGVKDYEVTDFDGDGIDDNIDTDDDNDGISDVDEIISGTDPYDSDSDGDGIPDGVDTKPLDHDNDGIPDDEDIDSDNDGISDINEILNGTNPNVVDSDGDGIPDGIDTKPLDLDNDGINDKLDFDSDNDGINDDIDLDDDNDGLSDIYEISKGMNPKSSDSDGDGIHDKFDSKPTDRDNDGIDDLLDFDSDNDGISDDLDSDDDNDGISDVDEVNNGTNPLSSDSDGDGISDQADDKPLDYDNDGIPDGSDEDSDNDGLSDAVEVTMGTNPYNRDTDGDGVSDKTDSKPLVYSIVNITGTDTDTDTDTNDNTVKTTINGTEIVIGEVETEMDDGQSMVSLSVDTDLVNEMLEGNEAEDEAVIEVNYSGSADILACELTGESVKLLEDMNSTLKIVLSGVEYIIPAKLIDIEKVIEEFSDDVILSDVIVNIKISDVSEEVEKLFSEITQENQYTIVLKPVSFEIFCSIGTSTVLVNKFNGYVERRIPIPEDVDINQVTTVVVINSDGTLSHIPTTIEYINGKVYACFKSLTNSEYSIISNPIFFNSVQGHWSEETVNDIASRLIISKPFEFQPDELITRGEFAEYIVKALGIYRNDSTDYEYTDVSLTHMNANAIAIASRPEYGIIFGYTDGTFRPDQQITREEAMVIIARAMVVTGLIGEDRDRIEQYSDFNMFGTWSINEAKNVVAAHIFNGVSKTELAPKHYFTCAEAAQAVKNLLVESELINE